MLYFSIFVLSIALFVFIYGILVLINKDKIKIEKRIELIKEKKPIEVDSISSKSFKERMLKPIYKSISGIIIKSTTKSKLAALNKRLEASGLSKKVTPEKWLYIKCMISLGFALLSILLSYSADSSIIKALFIGVVILITVNTFFNFYLSKEIELRKRKIIKELPYVLDLITVSVEAGLSFDGAIGRVISNISGDLCDEFGKSLKEIRMGIERKTALKNMCERCNVRELSMFVTSLIQADELGVSLSRVLRIESSNLREHRKQRARENAMKAPIKMLFPLIFFIFPTIFIIILGPTVIRMAAIFGAR